MEEKKKKETPDTTRRSDRRRLKKKHTHASHIEKRRERGDTFTQTAKRQETQTDTLQYMITP